MLRLFRKNIPLFPVVTWGDVLALGAAITVYVALAASTLTKFSIWFDEAFGSYLIRFDIAALTRYTANDVHPPFYYWLLKVWSLAFGNTEAGIRSMSIFFAAVTIIFVFLLVLRLFGRRAAYVSLGLLVITPFFVRYGQEARMYTLLTAIVVAATYVLTYATETKKRWAWITYGVLLALGMLTQYFAALAWAAHFVWRFITVRRPGMSLRASLKKVFDKQLIIAYGVAAALFCFWLPFLVIQFLTVQGHGFWIKPVTTATLPDYLTNVLLFTDSSGSPSWLAVALYSLIGIFVFLAYKLFGTLQGRAKSNYLLLLCIVVVPPAILLLLSMPPLRPAFVDRYLMVSALFLPIFMAVTLVLSRGIIGSKTKVAIGAVIVAMMVVGLFNQAVTGNYNKSSGQSNNTRQLLEAVRAKADSGVPVLTTTPWIFYEASIYDTPDSPIYYVDETTQYKYGSLTALAENEIHKIRDLDAFTSEHQELWVIGNLRDTAPRPLRESWTEQESIVINDDVTKKPLFRATRFSVE